MRPVLRPRGAAEEGPPRRLLRTHLGRGSRLQHRPLQRHQPRRRSEALEPVQAQAVVPRRQLADQRAARDLAAVVRLHRGDGSARCAVDARRPADCQGPDPALGLRRQRRRRAAGVLDDRDRRAGRARRRRSGAAAVAGPEPAPMGAGGGSECDRAPRKRRAAGAAGRRGQGARHRRQQPARHQQHHARNAGPLPRAAHRRRSNRSRPATPSC